MKLQGLELWLDPVSRPGPEAMAVDEWLLSSACRPVLRVYRWLGEWGSIGYFDSLGEAQASLPDIRQWVRRWSGGGTVDHRRDWTYTLVIPSTGDDQRPHGADSYRFIHQALATALDPEGLDVKLSGGEDATGAATCFDNPVTHDLVDSAGHKIAGAGQKRNKSGLLHQGSVALPLDGEEPFLARAKRLADALADGEWLLFTEQPPEEVLQSLQSRYEDPRWTAKRP